MPLRILATLLLAVFGLAALTVAIASEVLPDANTDNAGRLLVTGAVLVALAWRSRPRRD